MEAKQEVRQMQNNAMDQQMENTVMDQQVENDVVNQQTENDVMGVIVDDQKRCRSKGKQTVQQNTTPSERLERKATIAANKNMQTKQQRETIMRERDIQSEWTMCRSMTHSIRERCPIPLEV